jgi:hypothetical protein
MVFVVIVVGLCALDLHLPVTLRPLVDGCGVRGAGDDEGRGGQCETGALSGRSLA